MSSRLKNSIIYVFLGFLSPALNFFLVPLYTKYLSTEQYGIITLSAIFQAVLTSFIGIGVAGSYSRYYFDYTNNKERERLLDTCISINITSTIFVSIFLFFFGDEIFIYFFNTPVFTMAKYGWWTVGMALFTILQLLILAGYRNQERSDLYAALSTTFFLSGVGGVFVGVIFLKLEALGVIAGKSIGTIIPITVYLIYIYSKRKFKVNWKMSGPLLEYGYPIMIYALLTYFYKNVDKMIVSKHFDISILGLYGFATSIAMVTEIMVNALNNTFIPVIYKVMKDVNIEETLLDIKVQYEYIFLVMLFFILSFVSFSVPAIFLFINESYHNTLIWMPLLFVSYISRVYYVVYSVPVFYYKKTKILVPITVITLLTTIALSLFLIPLLGIFALIIVNFLANAIQVVAVTIYAKRAGIHHAKLYSFKKIHVQYLAIIVMVLVGYFLHYTIFSQSIHYFMGYFLLLWLLGTISFFALNYRHFSGIKNIILVKLNRN